MKTTCVNFGCTPCRLRTLYLNQLFCKNEKLVNNRFSKKIRAARRHPLMLWLLYPIKAFEKNNSRCRNQNLHIDSFFEKINHLSRFQNFLYISLKSHTRQIKVSLIIAFLRNTSIMHVQISPTVQQNILTYFFGALSWGLPECTSP